MSLEKKKAGESFSTMTEMVLPNDTNTFNNLMGGKMMHMMDVVSAIAAQRHSNSVVVTASVDNVSFSTPIKLGNVVTLHAQVTRTFKTSMEVHIEVWAENIPKKQKIKTNEAFFTFVALGDDGKPKVVPEVEPETDTEISLYQSALRRRQLRLILSKRMNPDDAFELKSLFIKE